MTATMSAQDIAEVMNRPYSRELLASRIPARLAYTGLDGDPRVVPVGYDWDGTHLTVASALSSAKTKALQANSKVAVSIDSEDFPPKVLLRGTERSRSSTAFRTSSSGRRRSGFRTTSGPVGRPAYSLCTTRWR